MAKKRNKSKIDNVQKFPEKFYEIYSELLFLKNFHVHLYIYIKFYFFNHV